MDKNLLAMLEFLKIKGLCEEWDALVAHGEREKFGHEKFLCHVVTVLFHARQAYSFEMRLKRASIPEILVMATYPFTEQPRLDRARVMNLYDSFTYMSKKQSLAFLGPTGVGKSGLGTAFLVGAIERGCTGRFIVFVDLLQKLNRAIATGEEQRMLKNFASYDCLLIDEIGYVEVESAQVGLFFRLMSMRHRKKTTIITSNLGFQQWGSFLKNAHLTAALIERLTSNAHVFNMKDCTSIRPQPIVT